MKTIKIQKPVSKKVDPDLTREPQTPVKTILRLDKTGRGHCVFVGW